MQHVYFHQYHDPNDEPSADPIDIDIEGDSDFTIDNWRQLIWTEIEEFNREHPEFTITDDTKLESPMSAIEHTTLNEDDDDAEAMTAVAVTDPITPIVSWVVVFTFFHAKNNHFKNFKIGKEIKSNPGVTEQNFSL